MLICKLPNNLFVGFEALKESSPLQISAGRLSTCENLSGATNLITSVFGVICASAATAKQFYTNPLFRSFSSNSRRLKYRTVLSEALSFTVLLNQTIAQEVENSDSEFNTTFIECILTVEISAMENLGMTRFEK